jgi:hypothetical protein
VHHGGMTLTQRVCFACDLVSDGGISLAARLHFRGLPPAKALRYEVFENSDPIGKSSTLADVALQKTLPNSGSLRDCDLQNMMESADNSVIPVSSGRICATAAISIVTTVLGPG